MSSTVANLSSEYDRGKFLGFVNDLLPNFARDIRTIADASAGFSDVAFLGRSAELDLQIFEVKVSGSLDKRVAIASEAFKLMKNTASFRSLVAFHSEDTKQWRLSLLTAKPIIEDGKVVTKFSSPKRFSYLLGPGSKLATPSKQLIAKGRVTDFEDLSKRFAVEVVNNEFYKEIAKLYDELVGADDTVAVIRYPGSKESRHEFGVRLIGRIIFCWFLREKRSTSGSSLVPEQFLSRNASNGSDYYHSTLAPLFFEVLNKRHDSRDQRFRDTKYESIPYLNGGLFSPDADDYYKFDKVRQRSVPDQVDIPNDWLQRFLDLLEMYNFTIDENTSFDIDLSIDPEMLGRIFENLLARINPETGETVRKGTGSFYTPREIVEYMVDQSLSNYLLQATSLPKDRIAALIDYDLGIGDELSFTVGEKQDVLGALSTVKILDPACGSGAFPIGMLQKIVFILQRVDPDAKQWLQKQLIGAGPELRRHLEQEFGNKNFDYLRKLGVIRESIYGVDIQPVATEISRLRCFLTLIVDQSVEDFVPNRGIEPLPNLDFKFVTANSLITLPGGSRDSQIGLFEDQTGIAELKELRAEYFSASATERDELKFRFVQTQKQMFQRMLDSRGYTDLTHMLSAWDPFSHNTTDWFDPEWMFGISDGFDIIIANPPWVFTREAKFDTEFKNYIQKKYIKRLVTSQTGHAKQSGKINLFAIFVVASLEYLKAQGQLVFILPNTLLRATVYDGVRKYLLDHTVIKQIVDLSTGRFVGVTASTIVIVLENSHNAMNSQVKIVADFDNLDASTSKTIDQSLFENNVSYMFNIFSDQITDVLTKKIKEVSNRLDKYVSIVAGGIATGPGKKDYIETSKRNDSYKPLIEGKDVKPYKIKFSNRYILYDRQKLHRARDENLFLVPEKLITQRIGGSSNPLIVGYDNEQFYTFNSTNLLIPRSNSAVSLKVICLLLNSKLLNWYYRTQFSNNSTLTVNISKTFLEQLPIREIDFEQQKLFIEFFEEALRLAQGNGHMYELQNEIDQHVYKLYNLTPEEILIIESSIIK